MVTLMLMGGATFAIGLIPSYATIGAWAPILVLTLRLLQGLALGGEYGGAATYVAEHAPAERRGFFTSWIQTTATLGLVISLAVIMATRASLSKEAFDEYGWRIPFLVSILMVLVSLLIRKNMEESPMFAQAKAEGKISTNPLKESFGNKLNLKYVLLALFGATMGQGLVWYTGQFYAQTFLLKICNLDDIQTNMILVIGLLLGTPLFVIFGALSDRIGRKGIMMAGMIIAVFSYRPIFDQMYKTVDVTNKTVVPGSEKMVLKGKTTTVTKEFTDGSSYKNVITEVSPDKTESKISIKINDKDQWTLIGYVFCLISFVTMAYGPIAAFLVEMFPTKIRYTSMSLPYHIGNGVFGGLMPAIATFLVSNAQTAGVVQKPYLEGLNYPIALISVCIIIGVIYIKSDKKAA